MASLKSTPAHAESTLALRRLGTLWLWAFIALAAAIALGLLLAELLMSPPAGELWDLGAYLAISGVATMAGGWVLLATGDRLLPLGVRPRAVLVVALATGVAMLNIFITAQMMFVSTNHDLPLLITAIAFSAIITVFFSLVVTSAMARRLRLVATGIAALSEGEYTHRIPESGGDEVARVAADINALARRLQQAGQERDRLDSERRELTAAISHDLRTPLASVRAVVEALEDGMAENEEEVRRYYGTIRREIARVGRMLDDLFELARLDAGALELDRRHVSLDEIAAEVADAMQAQALRHQISLRAEPPGPTPAAGHYDGARLERALGNLLRNAIEHTPAGGAVTIGVERRNGHHLVAVTDSGNGIDPDDLPRIWERFYRGEKSRHRGTASADGAGLGLAIVRGIAEAHGGSVEAASAPGKGTTFILKLPVDKPEAIPPNGKAGANDSR